MQVLEQTTLLYDIAMKKHAVLFRLQPKHQASAADTIAVQPLDVEEDRLIGLPSVRLLQWPDVYVEFCLVAEVRAIPLR